MADNSVLVGMARLWGQNEGIIFEDAMISSVLKGYDDMDLARLLEEWVYEYYNLPEAIDLEKFFERKVLALVEAHKKRIRLDGDWSNPMAKNKMAKYRQVFIVERDYKGEYERFALTHEEFEREFPSTYKQFGPFNKVVNTLQNDGALSSFDCSDSDTLKPMVHIWFCSTTIDSEVWTTFFEDMAWGLPQSDIDSGNLATIRLDLFGELKMYISPYTYVTANEHTGASEEALVKEWSDAMTVD